jgi:hypothetical protein
VSPSPIQRSLDHFVVEGFGSVVLVPDALHDDVVE